MSSLLNNSSILKNSAFKRPFTVLRSAPGAHDTTTGKWVPGATTPIEASGSIQPVTDAGLNYLQQAMEGGSRITQAIRIYSTFEFETVQVGTDNANGDVVVHSGLNWRIVRITDFAAHGHHKIYGVRTDGQDG